MKKILITAVVLLAGTAAPAQTPPPGPVVPPSPPARIAHPMHDKVMSRAEVVQIVREHFGKMDADKNGAITKTEIDGLHTEMFNDFKGIRGGHMTMGDPSAAFDQVDANNDGSISRDEFAAAREQRFERRIERREEIKDGDKSPKEGKEVRRHVMRMHGPGRFGGRMIVMADTNSDGQITLAEAEAMALQHFDQMDANKDGQITPEERRAGRPMIIKQYREEKKSGS